MLAAAAGVFIVGFSSIATGVNFITTMHMLRAPGMTWFRLPLMVWALYATSLVMVLATPVLAMSLLLVMAERLFGVPIFNPANGGDPLLFQHLFWFYSHPAVYIMILPAMGVVSEVVACFARRRVFGYAGMVYALMAIAVIGFMVWGHHMFVAGQSPYANLVFSFLSFIVAVPSAIKVFNWTATLYRGQISFEASMLYAMGFIGLFTIGGLDRLVPCLGADRHPRHRHLFRYCPFPFHHGRRQCHRLFCRHSLLVAENHRQDVQRALGARRRHHDVFRIQSDLPAAVRDGLARHAAPLSCLSRGVSDLARDVDRRRRRSRGRLYPAADLSAAVAAARAARAAESMGRHRARVADGIAAAQAQFRTHAGRRHRPVSYHPPTIRRPQTIRIATTQERRGRMSEQAPPCMNRGPISSGNARVWPSASGCFSPARCCFSAAVSRLRRLPHSLSARLCRRGQGNRCFLRHAEHRDPVDQQPDDGGRRQSVGRGFRRMTLWCLPPTALLGLASWCERLRVSRRHRQRAFSGPDFPAAPRRTQIFWTFYWVATGIHAIHLIVGIGIVTVTTALLYRERLP